MGAATVPWAKAAANKTVRARTVNGASAHHREMLTPGLKQDTRRVEDRQEILKAINRSDGVRDEA